MVEAQAQAEAFVALHRVALVRELLAYRASAVIGQGLLAQLRDMLTPLGGSAVRMAESMIEEAALQEVATLYDAPLQSRAVLIARLLSASARMGAEADLLKEAAHALQGRDCLQAAASRQTPTGKLRTSDPMEQIVEASLIDAGLRYLTDEHGQSPCHLDFYLPALDLHLEVKRMHSERIAEQMSRADNVIAAQGETAVRFLADRIRGPAEAV